MKSLMIACVICMISLISAINAANIKYQYPPIGLGINRIKKFGLNFRVPENPCENIAEYFYEDAVLDNFAPIDKQVQWESNGLLKGQRFWVNEELWGGVGYPVFVYIGGEAEESCRTLTSGLYMYTLAQQHKALLINVEHRFYGLSYPTLDMSTENLKYLSADQALADLARIITFVKSDMNTEDSQVITFGGSYPGNLAAWFRLKYPSISHGSVASSAPVIAKENFFEYMEVVGRSLIYYGGQVCYDAFEEAVNEIASLASQGFGSTGMSTLQKDFNTCGLIKNENDLGIFYSDLMGNVQGTVQYNFESTADVYSITSVCSTMTSNLTSSYQNLVKLSNEYASYYGESCEDANYDDVIAYISSTKKDRTNNYRPWMYQTCNEFGYFQTTDSVNQPFYAWSLLSLQFYIDMCTAAYDGWSYDPQTSWINTEFGALSIEGTNILFPSGTIDPWHQLAVQNTTDLAQPTEESVYILGTAHCADMSAPSSSDPEALTLAREVIADRVAYWLSPQAKKETHDFSSTSAASKYGDITPENSKESLFQFKQLGLSAQRLKKNRGLSRFHRTVSGDNAVSNADSTCGNTVEYYFTDAVVDNFAPIDKQYKWESDGTVQGQRYWVNEELWGGIGYPVFVYIGGEGQESCRHLNSGSLYMYTLAQQHQALLIDVEHRFYGQSYPKQNLTTLNLQFLSADQALADLARVVEYLLDKYETQESKVLTFGGSYPGNLAAWFRLKYPSISHGSVASSAPVYAKENFYEYMEVVGNGMRYFGGQVCFDAFAEAANQVATYAAQGYSSAGMTKIQTDFHTCGKITNDKDLGVLYSDLMGNVQGTVQYNLESSSPSAFTISSICAVMTNSSTSAYNNFVQLQSMYLSSNGETCEDASWQDLVSFLLVTAKDVNNDYRPWIYQTCNEFGYFQTTDSSNQPFYSWTQLNNAFYTNLCTAIFDGWKADPQTSWINNVYGSLSIEGTNILFPSGTIDPWHALAVQNTTSLPQVTEQSVYILGTAHCADMLPPSSRDPDSLTTARTYISDTVSVWLNDVPSPTLAPVSSDSSSSSGGFISYCNNHLILVSVLSGVILCLFAFAVAFAVNIYANSKGETTLSVNNYDAKKGLLTLENEEIQTNVV